jgi:hypothetical protein
VSTRRIVEGNAINIGRGLNEVGDLFVEPTGGVVRSSVGREHGRDDGWIALVLDMNRERVTAQFVDSHVHLRSYRVPTVGAQYGKTVGPEVGPIMRRSSVDQAACLLLV